MTAHTQFDHPATNAFIIDGHPYEIEAGAVWDATEAGPETSLTLSDCDDAKLRDLEVNLDWSQLGVPTPPTLAERVSGILADTGLLRASIERHVQEAC